MTQARGTGWVCAAGLVLLAATAAAQDASPPPKDIISDDDFASALPPLEDTQAPPAESSAAPEPAPPSSDTAVTITETPATAPDALPAVTVDDNDLDAPLPALQGYDVQPLQTAAVPDKELPEIRYTVDVDGLSQAGLYNRFKDLSALMNAKGRAVNTAMIRARGNEDEALALRLLKSEGYFDGTVTTTIAPVPDAPDQARVQMTVDPGPQYRFRLIDIVASPTQPPDLIRNALPLKKDDPIVANQVLAAEANVSVVMQQTGYPFVKIGSRDILLDEANQTGDYSLKVDTGDRSRFGGFRSDGDIVFKPDHVAVLTRFERGDLYDNRKVDDLREALIATGLFRSVGVEPVATTEKASDGTAYVDLLVHQQKGPSHTLAADIGYSTGEGFTATASWQDRNRFPPEGALIVTGALGTQEQSLATTFRRSNDKRRDRTTQASLSAAHNVYDAYDANTLSLSYSRSRVSTPLWQKVWTWSYGAEILATQEISTNLATNTSNIRAVYYLVDAPIRIGYDRSDDLLNPSKGFRLGVQTTPEVSLGGAGSPNIKTVFDASYYRAINAKMVVATRVRLGSQFGATLENIAPSRRLYAGGGGSVRGFAYQGLGPIDANGDPTGGLSLFEASAELRYRWGDLGIVPFIDIGQAYATTTPGFSDLRVGVGVGARLYTNFGPIRIDVATPLNRRSNEPQVALYVGIGQAF
ncbi:MAG: BamA/TamA family outer membrane protein [Asticcacaulis sp.]|nr:BamA/TamA family outer membrane protein [Asticcacaulis sp.]